VVGLDFAVWWDMHRLAWTTIGAALALTIAVPSRADAQEQSLTLSRALELGRMRSPQIKGARAHTESAEANIDEQRANYYPTLTATVTGAVATNLDTAHQPPPGQGFYSFGYYSSMANGATAVRWTLWDLGRTSGNVAAAEAAHRSAAATQSGTELSVMGDVANAYVTYHYKEQLRDVTKATLTQREKLVVIAKGLIKAGLQPPLEEIRAAARAEAARLQLATAEADVYDARAALAALLSLDPAAPLKVAPPRLPKLDMDSALAMREAEHLPSVTSASADHEAKEATADAAFARYLPTLSLAVDDNYRLQRLSTQDATLASGAVTGSLLVSVPIFDASIGPNLTGARADAATAAASLEQARRDARNEAARASFAVRTSAVALEHARRSADAAAAVLAIVQARYIQGLSSPLELIDAESSDADARTQRTQSELAYALAVVRILVATGRKIVEESP
jgi:outer membrane protein TolC